VEVAPVAPATPLKELSGDALRQACRRRLAEWEVEKAAQRAREEMEQADVWFRWFRIWRLATELSVRLT
jgi:hypothetical protein